MADYPGGGARGLRFLGGLILGILLVGGGIVALSVTTPIPERRVQLEPEPTPVTAADSPVAAASGNEQQVSEGELVATIAPEDTAPTDPTLPDPVPQPSADSVRGTLEPSQPAEDGRFSAPEPFETTVTDGQLGGLPPAATLEGPGPLAEAPQVEEPAFQLQGPALTLNAAPFEPREDLPLIAVILNDAGESPLAVETLLSLPMPLTMGIAPRSEADVDLAAEAKLAGYEVLAQFPISDGAENANALLRADMSDVEVAEQVERKMAELWMSIGAASLPEGSVGLDERLLRSVVVVLERNGFAFVNPDAASFEAGLNMAQAVGVAYAGQTRDIAADATEEEVYEALERAAADAQSEGQLIVSGPPTRAMLAGVLKWHLERDRRSAQLAPLSAVIRRINAS